jgi:hypothetical protein|nr:MAG TPA: hypothetical protein [Crassvirales sp.]
MKTIKNFVFTRETKAITSITRKYEQRTILDLKVSNIKVTGFLYEEETVWFGGLFSSRHFRKEVVSNLPASVSLGQERMSYEMLIRDIENELDQEAFKYLKKGSVKEPYEKPEAKAHEDSSVEV